MKVDRFNKEKREKLWLKLFRVEKIQEHRESAAKAGSGLITRETERRTAQ